MHQPGSLDQLERAMAQVNLRLDNVRHLVITHLHSDHWGEAATVLERSGCQIWMHPNHRHATEGQTDSEAALSRRMEVGRQSGVPEAVLVRYFEQIKEMPSGVAGIVEPDHALVDGVVLDTDLGPWTVYETPGHAPSHICLFQPENRLLISGDHVLGRISLFFEYGWTPDPIGEFLGALDRVDALDARLCMSGHGRTFTDVHAHIEGTRALVWERLEAAATGLAPVPQTALELVPAVFGEPFGAGQRWRLMEVMCYLRHLEVLGRVVHEPDGSAERWRLAAGVAQHP
jgi:glyoxylase-like metal-dependent hydrolase (beta-lactamase superfamily II)